MRWRKVSEAEVLKVLDVPDRIEETVVERKNAYKALGDRLLKITYKDEESETIVITVTEKKINRG
jgi:hypothetical protein